MVEATVSSSRATMQFAEKFSRINQIKVQAIEQDGSSIKLDFGSALRSTVFFFALRLGQVQDELRLNQQDQLPEDHYDLRIANHLGNTTESTITEMIFANLAASQYVYWFNSNKGTEVTAELETLDGTPFVTFDLKNTREELVFNLGYELGLIQERLTREQEIMLPTGDFPLPPENASE